MLGFTLTSDLARVQTRLPPGRVPPMTTTHEALLLIDLQEDYFADDELARCRADVLKACNDLARAAEAAGVPVLEVRTEHEPDRSTWTLTMLEDDQGVVVRGTAGAARAEGLDPGDAELVVKTRDSAFFRTDLAARLRSSGCDVWSWRG